jgi:hypothetical protein
MTSIIEETDTRTIGTDEGDHDTFKHYVYKTELDRAILEGVPCTALCGKKWLPSKDYTKYPTCPTCKEIYETIPQE